MITDHDDSIYEDANNYIRHDTTFPYCDAPSTNIQYRNSLQKLPINSSANIDFKIGNHTTSTATGTIPRDNIYQSPNTTIPIPEPILERNEETLQNASFRILQTKLAMKGKSLKDKESSIENGNIPRPMYYRPPSANVEDTSYGIKNFLPPNVYLGNNQQQQQQQKTKKNKIPIMFGQQAPKFTTETILQSIRDEQDDENVFEENGDYVNPSGDWMNPVMKQALNRQIDQEYEVKKLLKNLIYLITFILFKSLLKKVIYLYDLKLKSQPYYIYLKNNPKYETYFSSDDINLYLFVISNLIMLVFIINIIWPLIKVLKGQDQCYDLPLSEKQRKLIGLKALDIEPKDNNNNNTLGVGIDRVDETAELTLKQRRYDLINKVPYKQIPKYTKLNDYSVYKGKLATSVKPTSLIQPHQDSNITGQSVYSVRSMLNPVDNATNIANKSLVKHAYSQETIDKAKSKFSKNFNIEFNIDK